MDSQINSLNESKADLVKKATAIMARRIRIERVELFQRVASAEKSLRAMLNHFTKEITSEVEDKAHSGKNAKRISDVIHREAVLLRASLRIWINAAIRDSAKMGFRHIGDALLPLFKKNREAVEQVILADRVLYESAVRFGIGLGAVSVATTATKWDTLQKRLVKQTKKNLAGLSPSDRVWDLTTRAEQDLKRMVVNGIANSENPAVIARRIRKYISPTVQDASELGVSPGAGVYRSPYRNAMRLARTEMNRTYTKAQAAFANDKPWVQGVEITLSPNHTDADECDDLASGGPYSADEAGQLIPAHPHCMCYLTPVIDPKYLGEEEEE